MPVEAGERVENGRARNMPRVLRFFDKSDELLMGEEPLPVIQLVVLQRIFGVSDDDPMYDSYLVNAHHATCLERFLPLTFDFVRFDYFLEYED